MLQLQSTPSVEDIFDRLANHLDSYEHRPQQLELAFAIERAIATKKTGVFEAGTGTGKSLAALVPATLASKSADKKIVISTATIALQEQYIHKDIPLLKSILPFEIEATIMKGRSNYIGLRRWKELLLEEAVDDRIVDWVNNTEAGDISELDFMPPVDIWTEMNSDADDCMRNKCPKFNDCFYFGAKKQAETANILIVNHALLLADAASFGNILPKYDILIVDEAQHLPDIARDAFSASISQRGIRMLAARAVKKVSAPMHLVREMEVEAERFFSRLNMQFSQIKTRIKTAVEYTDGLKFALKELRTWLEEDQFEHILDVDMAREKAKLKAKSLLTTIDNYLNCLDLLDNPNKDWVVWVEKGDAAGSRLAVVASPLQVADFINDFLFNKPGLESSVWMSATLATNGEDPFAYFKHEIGVSDAIIQTKVSSPFDYKNQSLLYLPKHLPEPNHPDYIQQSSQTIEELIKISQGSAFVLFTSYYAMNKTYDLLAQALPYPCKKQGEMPRRKLIEWYLQTPNAVLFGTSSFWEGVSIEGEKLGCVIIDRIPFQVPDDPIWEARCEALKENNDGDWFKDLALPHAIMRLKQGVGRLIRTRSDYGMVAVLDPRMTRKAYGRQIVQCLPPMNIINSTNKITSLVEYFGK